MRANDLLSSAQILDELLLLFVVLVVAVVFWWFHCKYLQTTTQTVQSLYCSRLITHGVEAVEERGRDAK